MLVTVDAIVNQAFDYIIVGGGLAGLVLAARLSEDPNVSVCVLEGGAANLDDPAILRTGIYATQFGQPAYDWAHMSTKQKLMERSLLSSRGRGLGGSSNMNFMVLQRPPSDEIDDFERLGNPGWNWKNLLRYMKKSERFVDPPKDTDEILSIPYKNWNLGREGPLLVSFPRTATKLEEVLQQALIDCGFPTAEDPYGGNPHGAYYSVNTYNPYTYARSYSAPAYYAPNKGRQNLKVLVSARVNRLQTERLHSGSLIATGVEFTHEGKTHVVKAAREVLVCAGALRSPTILERSGIGRTELLRKAEIPVKLDLPGVGENLQEHITGGVIWELKKEVSYPTFDVSRDTSTVEEQLELYKNGKGSFCMGIMNFAFLSVADCTPRAEEIYKRANETIEELDKNSILPGLFDQYKIQLDRLKPAEGQVGPGCELIMSPGKIVSLQPSPSGKKYISIYPALNHPLSRGTIHIKSSDPSEEPDIDPHYFENPADLEDMVELIKLARKIGGQSRLKELISHEVFPGPNVQTDDEIAAYLKQSVATTWHTAATCSMLPRDKGGVVDHHLKVYGTENIRVIDLSIVPLYFAAHPQCVVYGIAEMVADIIKGNLKI